MSDDILRGSTYISQNNCRISYDREEVRNRIYRIFLEHSISQPSPYLQRRDRTYRICMQQFPQHSFYYSYRPLFIPFILSWAWGVADLATVVGHAVRIFLIVLLHINGIAPDLFRVSLCHFDLSV